MKNLGLKVIISVLALAIIGMFYVLVGAGNNNSNDSVKSIDEQVLKTQEYESDETEKVENEEVKNVVKADKIEIIEFHATNRCYSCNKMAELIKKTLEEKFKGDLDSGRITFQEINGELPENNAIVSKYKATGLSVFINEIENGTDNIKEETTLWRLLEDEEKFKNYLSDIINKL